MRSMKGARALASGMLVLVAVCAVPAISAAQDAGTTTSSTTTTPTTTDPAPVTTTPDATSAGAAAGTPSEAANSPKETTPQLGRGSPADAPAGGAASDSSPVAKKSSSASVSMVNFTFSPSSVTVNVGDTVTWSNKDDAPHNATADDGSFSTPNINKGQSASHRFTQAGSFSYICTIHPNMHGTVRVLSSSSGGGGGSAGSSSSGSSQSESSAVASPDAAGDANTLPMTGLAAGALALVGLAMLSSGLLVRAWHRRVGRERQLTLF
jgi:plastocyanin